MLVCRNFQEEFIIFFTTTTFAWLFGYLVATLTSSPTSDVYDSSEDEADITVENTKQKTQVKRKKGVYIRLR